MLAVILQFHFIAIPGICLGILEGSNDSCRAVPKPMCLPNMTEALNYPFQCDYSNIWFKQYLLYYPNTCTIQVQDYQTKGFSDVFSNILFPVLISIQVMKQLKRIQINFSSYLSLMSGNILM